MEQNEQEFRDKVALRFLDKFLTDSDFNLDVTQADEDIREEAKNIADCVWQYTEAFVYGRGKSHTVLKEEAAKLAPISNQYARIDLDHAK